MMQLELGVTWATGNKEYLWALRRQNKWQIPGIQQRVPRTYFRRPWCVRSKRAFLLAVLFYFCCLNSISTAGNSDLSDCGTPVDVSNLAASLDRVLRIDGPIVGKDLARLRRDLHRAEAALRGSGANAHRLHKNYQSFDLLVHQTRKIIREKMIHDPEKIVRTLRELRSTSDVTCSQEPPKGGQSNVVEGSNRIPRTSETARQANQVPMVTFDASDSDAGGQWKMFLIILLAIAAGIVLTHLFLQLFNLVFSLFHDRMACRISASLQVGSQAVDGHITILSRRGFRFQPINADAVQQFEDIVGAGVCTTVVGSQRLPAEVTGLHAGFVSVWFSSALSAWDHRQLLKLSGLDPYYTKTPATKSNRERYLQSS